MSTITMLDRIHGSLLGIAAGDAMGMPALSTLEQTIALWGGEITTFIDASTIPNGYHRDGRSRTPCRSSA